MNSASSRKVITTADARRLRAVLDTPAARGSPFATLLEGELARATLVDPARVPPDVITMNSRVIYATPMTMSIEVQLVYPWDDRAIIGNISVLSALGVALLGSRIGGRILSPIGVELGLTQMLYQPEEAGDLYL